MSDVNVKRKYLSCYVEKLSGGRHKVIVYKLQRKLDVGNVLICVISNFKEDILL